MSDYETYLARIGAAAQKRCPMTPKEWRALIAGLGIPLAFLLLLVAFSPR